MYKKLLLFFILLPTTCLAQFTISGKLLDYSTKLPVANADIFINNATIGTNSSDNGTFVLKGIKSGKYDIIVSIVGYNVYSQSVIIGNRNITLPDIYLIQQSKMLREVVVRPHEINSAWYDMFKKQFIGTSELAQDCTILNPQVINLQYDDNTKTLTASSDDYIQIENDALGYLIKYQLISFQYSADETSTTLQYKGNVRYAQLPGSVSRQRGWQQARLEAYKNSALHFYRAAIADSVAEEGFQLQQLAFYDNPNRPSDSIINAEIKHCLNHGYELRDSLQYWRRELKVPKRLTTLWPYALRGDEILHTTNSPGIFAITCEMDGLFVTYNENKHFSTKSDVYGAFNPRNRDITLIRFNAPIDFLNTNGTIINTDSIYYTGVWANQRMADYLPIDYEPSQNNEPVDSAVSKKIIAGVVFAKKEV